MKKQSLLIIIMVLVTSVFAHGQIANNLPSLSERNINDIQFYFQKYYKVKGDFEMNACVKTMVYAKFKVTPYGKIESLEVSKVCPNPIKTALKAVINATNGHWKLNENGRKKIGPQVFLLPLLCYYEGGCSPGLVDTASLKQPFAKSLFPVRESDTMFDTSVLNMMDFESGRYKSLNCILINPITVGVLQ